LNVFIRINEAHYSALINGRLSTSMH
jgi:hypothetical protein